jgi:ribonuclease HII
MICGIDEVGRGCLAGRVHACAVVFHGDLPDGLRDSKTLSARARATLDVRIREVACVSIGIASLEEIEALNILHATMLAMKRAYEGLPEGLAIEEVLIDGNRVPDLPLAPGLRSIVKGDASQPAIAAASICAKVARDAEMAILHDSHPEYDWIRNMGYGSPKHLAAIAKHGPTPHHRMGFGPLRQPGLDL